MKIGVFIPVRLDSTRLPQKALLEIMGKPVLQHLVERIKLASTPDLVVICTSTDPADDRLREVADACGVELFRGSKEDILERFLRASEANQVDLIVNVDGDDILVDPEQVDAVANRLQQTGADFIKCEGLPFGAAPVGIKVEALERVCALKDQSDTATGWGRYFTDNDTFKTETLKVEDELLRHPEIRMTLDYQEDYRFFQAVFAELYEPGKPVRLREAIRLILSKPAIKEINANLEERYWAHFNSAPPPAVKPS